MAEVGTAVIEIDADTRKFDRKMRNAVRRATGRVTWPEASCFVAFLGFVGFVIEKVVT